MRNGDARRGDASGYVGNLRQIMAWIAAGELKPVVSATYPLARTADALTDMMDRKVQGKIAIVMDPDTRQALGTPHGG